jgi:hypothetical protein
MPCYNVGHATGPGQTLWDFSVSFKQDKQGIFYSIMSINITGLSGSGWH